MDYAVLTPYLGNYSKGFHIRKIARMTDMNHRTVALHLERLEKEGVLKHAMEGRNKVYYLNAEKGYIVRQYIANVEFMMKMEFRLKVTPASMGLLIKELFELLSAIFPLHVKKDGIIILFGSYASGHPDKNSDIDIMIIDGAPNLGKVLSNFGLTYGVKTHEMHMKRADFEKALKEKDPLVMEILGNHVIINNEKDFVDILWRHFHG